MRSEILVVLQRLVGLLTLAEGFGSADLLGLKKSLRHLSGGDALVGGEGDSEASLTASLAELRLQLRKLLSLIQELQPLNATVLELKELLDGETEKLSGDLLTSESSLLEESLLKESLPRANSDRNLRNLAHSPSELLSLA